MIISGNPDKLLRYFDTNGCLTLYDVRVIKRRQHMRLCAARIFLCSAQAFRQNNHPLERSQLRTTPKGCSFTNLLLWRGDRHIYTPLHTKVLTSECNALCMISSRRTDKFSLLSAFNDFAHRIKGTSNFIRPNRREVFTLKVNFSAIDFSERYSFFCNGVLWKKLAHLCHSIFGGLLEIDHVLPFNLTTTFKCLYLRRQSP